MREAINVARPEDETTAKLKRILPQFVLPVAGRTRAFPRLGVVAAEQMQQIRRFQLRDPISLALLVDQQRKCDPGFLAEELRVPAVTKSDCG